LLAEDQRDLKRFNSGSRAYKVALISGGHFAHDVFSSFLAPFLPLLIAKFGLSITLAGTLTVFFRLPSLANPLIGIISDRIDLKHCAVVAPAVTAIAMSLLGIAPGYGSLAVLLLIAGTSAAVFHVLGPVMIARASHEHLGKDMGYWMIGGELARTVGPLIAVGVVTLWSFEGSYPIMIFGILASLFLHFNLKDANLGSVNYNHQNMMQSWTHIRNLMIPLTGFMIFNAFVTASLSIFLPVYMVTTGKSLWIGGASLAVLELAGTVGIFLGGSLSDRFGRRVILLVAIPFSSILLIAFVYSPEWLLLPIIVALGISVFAVAPVKLAIVQDHSKDYRGTANGFYTGISFLVSAGTTVLVGWLADCVGVKNAFIISAFLGFAAMPLIFLLPGLQTVKTAHTVHPHQ